MKRKILLYIAFLIPTFLVVAGVWSFLISANFFYCSDRVSLLDFIPPFVHGSEYGDYYIQSPVVTYLAWSIHLLLVFLLPYILTKKLAHK